MDRSSSEEPQTLEDIRRQVAEAGQRLLHSWRWYRDRRAALAGRRDARVDLRRLDTLWQRALGRYLEDIEALNRCIEAHNRRTPSGQEEWPRLDPQVELRRLGIEDVSIVGEGQPNEERPALRSAPRPPDSPLAATIHQIVTLREKIPHTPHWERARKRTLWRYLSRWQDLSDKE